LMAEHLPQMVYDGTAVAATDIHEPNYPTVPSSGSDASVTASRRPATRPLQPRSSSSSSSTRPSSSSSPHPSDSSAQRVRRAVRGCIDPKRRTDAIDLEGSPALPPRARLRAALFSGPSTGHQGVDSDHVRRQDDFGGRPPQPRVPTRAGGGPQSIDGGLPSLVEAHGADHAHPEDDEPNHHTASSEDDTSDSAAANGPRPAHPQTAETASASSSPSEPRESLDWREINRESCATRRANAMSSSRTITSPRTAVRAALRASEQRRHPSRRTPSSDTRNQQNRFPTDPQRSERNSGFVNSAAQVIPSASCDGARLVIATTEAAGPAGSPRARTVLPSNRPPPAAPPAVGYGQHHRDLTVSAATAGRANRSLGGCSDAAASLAATDRSRRLAPGGGGRVDTHGS
jgi:hypothetical protein